MDETSLAPAPESAEENLKPSGDLVQQEPPQEHPDFDNLCGDEEILAKFRSLVRTKFEQFQGDRSEYDDPDDGIWANCEYMHKCGLNDSKRTSSQSDDTNADCGTTLFFRQCRALASYIVAIFLSRKRQFQHIPLNIDGAFSSTQEASLQASFHDALTEYTFAKDDMKLKIFELANMLVKYGNLPIMVRWNYRTASRKARTPERDETGNIIGYTFTERKYVVDNQPTIEVIPIECLYADRHIGTLQKQQAIIIQTGDELANLFALQRDGQVKNVQNISAGDFVKGNENNLHQAKQESEGIEPGDESHTGLINRFDAWAKVPIGLDANGKPEWDEKKHEPTWYWGVFAGSLENGPCLLLRETYDRDKKFPGEMLHLFPDDPDKLYHFGPAQAISPIYDEITTKKNQAIDNVTLQNRRPLKAVRGEVFSKDLTYSQNKAIWVERAESLTEMQVASQLGDTMAAINYLEDECNKALGTDKPFMGEALGSRTSATEANNVFQRTMQPAMMLAQYVMNQLKFIVRTCDGLWELFAMKDQELAIVGMERPMTIKPAEMFGEFDVEVTVVDEFMNDAIAAQNINYLIQAAQSIPGWQQDVDTKKFNQRVLEVYKFDTNPQSYMKSRTSYDAERVAYHENIKMTEGQTTDIPEQGEDHAAHLKQHESFRQAFNGLEDQYPPRYLDLLDQHIAIHKQMMEQSAPPMQPPTQAPSGNETPGEVAGNGMAAQMGSMNMGG